MVWFVVAAASLVAGIIQAVTGFGSVVFLMMILPFYFIKLTWSEFSI